MNVTYVRSFKIPSNWANYKYVMNGLMLTDLSKHQWNSHFIATSAYSQQSSFMLLLMHLTLFMSKSFSRLRTGLITQLAILSPDSMITLITRNIFIYALVSIVISSNFKMISPSNYCVKKPHKFYIQKHLYHISFTNKVDIQYNHPNKYPMGHYLPLTSWGHLSSNVTCETTYVMQLAVSFILAN
jgi:hypothetical protein